MEIRQVDAKQGLQWLLSGFTCSEEHRLVGCLFAELYY